MTDKTIPIPADFDEVKAEIWESDLILIRNRSGKHVRIAKASWWNGELFCVTVRKYRGVTAVPLGQLVRRYPGRIDVYEANPKNRWENYDRQGATGHLKTMSADKFDLQAVLLNMLRNIVSTMLFKSETRSEMIAYGADAIRIADRLGGNVEPLPDRREARIEASDFVLSPFYHYSFTLK